MEYSYNANHDLKNNKSSTGKSSIVLTNEFFSKLRELISEDQVKLFVYFLIGCFVYKISKPRIRNN